MWLLDSARGEVESIGFANTYRPNCFTPMVVRLQVEKTGKYQIRVTQYDLDGDEQVFVEPISLTGTDEGNAEPQRFWMYFIPQPTDGGLPDITRTGTLRELQQAQQERKSADEAFRGVRAKRDAAEPGRVPGGGFGNGTGLASAEGLALADADRSYKPMDDYSKSVASIASASKVGARAVTRSSEKRVS